MESAIDAGMRPIVMTTTTIATMLVLVEVVEEDPVVAAEVLVVPVGLVAGLAEPVPLALHSAGALGICSI